MQPADSGRGAGAPVPVAVAGSRSRRKSKLSRVESVQDYADIFDYYTADDQSLPGIRDSRLNRAEFALDCEYESEHELDIDIAPRLDPSAHDDAQHCASLWCALAAACVVRRLVPRYFLFAYHISVYMRQSHTLASRVCSSIKIP